MEVPKPQRGGSPAKVSPRNQQFLDLAFDKEILLCRDVNGIALTQDNILLLALGPGSRGGIGRLDLESEQLTVHQGGKAYRNIMIDDTGMVLASTCDTICTYAAYDLDNPISVLKPGPSLWGFCVTPDNQLIFGDVVKKKVYNSVGQCNNLIVQKTPENNLRSVWSLECDGERLYISDRKKRQVVCTTLDGTFLWRQKLGRPFQKFSKVLQDTAGDYFGGMCKDGNENVLVCDSPNNRLTQLSAEGAMAHYHDLDLDKPADVAVNSGCVVIVNDPTLLDCKIRIYRQSTTL